MVDADFRIEIKGRFATVTHIPSGEVFNFRHDGDQWVLEWNRTTDTLAPDQRAAARAEARTLLERDARATD